MATKDHLRAWVVEALEELGGSARVVEVARQIWASHEDELRKSGDLFFTWQYDMRWAAMQLRDAGTLEKVYGRQGVPWTLGSTASSGPDPRKA